MSRIIRLTLNGGTLAGIAPLGATMETATGAKVRIEVLGVIASGEYLVKVL